MSRKSLTKPQPKKQLTSEEIASFVLGGAGQDAEKTGMARLTVDLPRETHRRFKIACTVADIRMNDEIRRFIERRCVELEASR